MPVRSHLRIVASTGVQRDCYIVTFVHFVQVGTLNPKTRRQVADDFFAARVDVVQRSW